VFLLTLRAVGECLVPIVCGLVLSGLLRELDGPGCHSKRRPAPPVST